MEVEGWLPVDMTEDTFGLPQHKSHTVQGCMATEKQSSTSWVHTSPFFREALRQGWWDGIRIPFWIVLVFQDISTLGSQKGQGNLFPETIIYTVIWISGVLFIGGCQCFINKSRRKLWWHLLWVWKIKHRGQVSPIQISFFLLKLHKFHWNLFWVTLAM